MRPRSRLAFALTFSLALVGRAHAQATDELTLIRDATVREQAGDFAGAEQLYTRILSQNPQSLSALLSLERVLRMEGKVKDLVPFVESHLKADPTSAIGHQMLIRAYSSLDQLSDIDRAADAWMRAAPKVETPYREIARIWTQRGDYTRAMQYLELGRQRVGKSDALALELGDVYAALEEYPRAVREWDKAIGPEARGLLLVQRRLTGMRDGGAQLLSGLVDALLRSQASFARRRAAAMLAIDAGLDERAEDIVRATATDLKGLERQGFLVEMARRADAAQLPRVAYWAYSQLTPSDLNPEQSLAVRARVAELALVTGDTASAARSYRDLEQQFGVGSPQRRQAAALRIQLMVKEGRLADAENELATFRTQNAAAPELDAIAASLANAFLDKDDPDRAEKSVIGATGPRSNVARGRIALRRGDITAAKAAMLNAAPFLQGAEATEAIRMVTLLGKVSKPGGEMLGKAIAQAGGGSPKAAIGLLEKGAENLPELERPAILDFAAAIADRSEMQLDAERMRRRIVVDFPKSMEAPSALLSLARSLTERGEQSEEARQYLEKLILEYPRSALVPQARQELDRLQGRVPRS